ncbi:dysbindin protein homolog [Helicoverpa armigera]|uniref:dysbindin protein homolog n=1 Tax=Helicoverpa armigera TaxID=29058 RepID=UPI001F583E31|nr:dysbindin protein homolog [Helicoverpa armigera]XP_047035060.1 dysbindin protein homolog [Helicoverpa zea]
MLGNLKDFISVVQDGLASNNNIRQTLQEVQKVKNIFKDKQKFAHESKVNYGAGGALLEKYQEDWAKIHENADNNAKAADEVDKLIVELHEVTKKRLQSANELAHNLSFIPSLTASVAECMDSLKNVQEMLKSVEEELVEFEDIVERSKMENWKLDHHYHLTMYKEKKMVALEEVRNKLAKENSQLNYERERQQLAELQSRREQSSNAFQQDVAKYLASGTITTSQPSTPKITLEQIQLDDDRTDLEKFLDS